MMKERIKKAALELIAKNGINNLGCDLLCERAGVARGSFSYHMGCSFRDFLQQLISEGHDGGLSIERGRVIPELRKKQILAVALKISEGGNFANLSRAEVAGKAGCSVALINKYYGSLDHLKYRVMAEAVSSGVAAVIAQGLAVGHALAKAAPQKLIDEAATYLARQQ